ncbi:MAG TPA: hypothetical protein DCP69_00315 [Candidatus Omnitrophica bacterium]|nr:hypothetical protein [Candidatus Omnitrophota bacterium]
MKKPERLTVMMNFRCSPEQARLLRRMARVARVSISKMLRDGLTLWLERDEKELNDATT